MKEYAVYFEDRAGKHIVGRYRTQEAAEAATFGRLRSSLAFKNPASNIRVVVRDVSKWEIVEGARTP